MVAGELVRMLLEQRYPEPNSRERAARMALRRLAVFAPKVASLILDEIPEMDREGMQVFRPCPSTLRDAGTPHRGELTQSPMTHSLRRFGSIDDQLATGEWDSGPGRHIIKFDFDEWVHVLEGEADVTVQGVTRRISAGDVALFRAGLSMTWDVPRYIRKVWVHRYARPSLMERALDYLQRQV